MDVSVTEVAPETPPGATDAAFAAGAATVISAQAAEVATEAAEAAVEAVAESSAAADVARSVAADAASAELTAELAHDRIDQLWEVVNDFREDLVDVMNEVIAENEVTDLPPTRELEDQAAGEGDNDGGKRKTPKPRKGLLESWFNGR